MSSYIPTSNGTITLTNTTGFASGSTITTGATTNWANPNTKFTSSNGTPVMTLPHGEEKVVVEKQATLEIKGNVVMNGIDLDERLKTIEKVLAIPERDANIELKHPKLKKLYDEYISALEQYRTWERLKGEDE